MNKITQDIDAVTDGRSARWQAHRSQRHTELLKLARKAVHKLGPQVSMEDIAAHAKTSKPVYYRYFGDKEGLRQALGAVVIADFRDSIIAAGLAEGDEAGALRAMVTAYLELAKGSPNLYFFVTAQAPDVLTAPDRTATGSLGVLNAFFDEVTALMNERLTAHLAGNTHSASRATGLWPRAALGMIRSAGEIWLRQPEGEDKATLNEMAQALSSWLTHGISTTQRSA
ncbi:TetR/AcrR family transcriptional regulator [Glutamicibacter sp.]|uniref:TetR/AcrR family transcriptional regulator n=1 Tax=Glutamicibacter sp. TaxID=1931995 RepID=UPI002B465700|nr:TetR/AcrR family transcriptional regulator [Glutamicibacter sp.]HJX77212.1 TetR/AcrR family transcriptional regulator [Glutamicibacter sp.]